MLKITVTGNLTRDAVLKIAEDGVTPVAVLRIASDRRYRDKDGIRRTDFVSVKLRGHLAEYCARSARKGCKLAVAGDFETIAFEEPGRQPGFLIKGTDVELLSSGKPAESSDSAAPAETEASGRCDEKQPAFAPNAPEDAD